MDDKKQRIMVVDDDKVLLKNAAVLLGVNYSVSLYSGGREALEALSDKALPDLILLDVRMPDIDGYSVIIEIKSMPKCRNIPVRRGGRAEGLSAWCGGLHQKALFSENTACKDK